MTLVLADPVCRLVFDRGDQAAEHLHYTALALQLLAVALFVYASERVIMQGFFSLQRMWAPSLLGIVGAFVQVGFMVVPILGFGKDQPAHVFVLVALSYPVSRAFKNGILLLMLRRHVPVLPSRESLAFAVRLAVLSAVVGVCVWGSLLAVRHVLPYEQYREHVVSVGPEAGLRVPPRTLPYALVMMAHCSVPSVVGLVVMVALLKALRFPELGYVIRWVRERGWKRRGADEGAPDATA
jgi:hypothetical protein